MIFYDFSSNRIIIWILFYVWTSVQGASDQWSTVPTPLALLPECTKTTVVTGEVIQEELDTRKISISTNLRLNLGLKETVCIYVQTQETSTNLNGTQSPGPTSGPTFPYNNGTLIYVIQYIGLNQLHPLRQRYEFAIPYLESKCICDCPGAVDHCPIGYQYKNCTKNKDNPNSDSVCVTTYFAHQPSTGCLQGQESEICCELSARPYENRRFTAIYIGQSDAVAEFRYQLYTAPSTADAGGSWTKSTDETFRVSLNRHQRLEFANDRLEMRVSGTKPFYQLKDGMYFYENFPSSTVNSRKIKLRDGLPLNELHEYDLGRLGWFRRRNEKWTVRNAWIRLQDAHKVQVKNCKDQTYSESFNAEYYVTSAENMDESGGSTNVPLLGHEVVDEEPWIDEIRLEMEENPQSQQIDGNNLLQPQRLIVGHKDSNPIEIDLTMDNRIQLLKLVHHSSALSDFSGSIQIDKSSNRFLNLTLIGARGTLIGAVYRSITGRSADLAFSHYVGSSNDQNPNYRVTIALPAQVNASKWVCIHPLNRVKDEICKWLLVEMAIFDDKETPANGLTAQRGQCADCNEMTIQNFLHYLNPAQWFNGISSPTEALAMGVEILFYGALILIAVALFRRLACPLIRWAVCGGDPCCAVPTKRPGSATTVTTA